MNCALCKQPIKSPSLCKRCQDDWRSKVQSALDRRDVNTAVSHLAQLLPGMVRAALNTIYPDLPGRAFKQWQGEGISAATKDAYELLNPPRVLPLKKNGKKTKPRITIKDADHLQAYYAERCRSLVRDRPDVSSGKSLGATHALDDRRTEHYLETIHRLANLAMRLAPKRLRRVVVNIRRGMEVSDAITLEGKRRAALGLKRGFPKDEQNNRDWVKRELRELGIWTEAAADDDDITEWRSRLARRFPMRAGRGWTFNRSLRESRRDDVY